MTTGPACARMAGAAPRGAAAGSLTFKVEEGWKDRKAGRSVSNYDSGPKLTQDGPGKATLRSMALRLKIVLQDTGAKLQWHPA
jgi:hypothetical protein